MSDIPPAPSVIESALRKDDDMDLGGGGGHLSVAVEFIAPEGYKVKKCKYCRALSNSKSPLPTSVFPSWAPCIPWGDGKLLRPKGLTCRICINVTT